MIIIIIFESYGREANKGVSCEKPWTHDKVVDVSRIASNATQMVYQGKLEVGMS
jgi:hypothetical protein